MFGPNTLSLTALLALILALGPVSTDMYVVILSLLPDALDTTIDMAQLTMTVFLVSWAIAQLFAGALADRFGRKPVMLGGLGFFIVASIACAFATSIEALIAFRFVQALGACTAAVLPRAIVRDLHGREQAARVLGYMGSFLGFVLIFGPILSSYLTVWYGWQANFWLMVVFCAVTIVLVVPLYRESLPTPDLTALDLTLMWRSFARLLSHRAFLGYALTYAFLNGAMFTYFTVSSFLIIDLLDVPAEEFGYYFGGTMVGYVIGSYLTDRFGPRLGIDAVLKASVALAAIAAIAGFVLAWAGGEPHRRRCPADVHGDVRIRVLPAAVLRLGACAIPRVGWSGVRLARFWPNDVRRLRQLRRGIAARRHHDTINGHHCIWGRWRIHCFSAPRLATRHPRRPDRLSLRGRQIPRAAQGAEALSAAEGAVLFSTYTSAQAGTKPTRRSQGGWS